MNGKPWPDCAGFWQSGGQIYYAKATTTRGDYHVRDCRNYDVTSFVDEYEFNSRISPNEKFPWLECTLTVNEEKKDMPQLGITIDYVKVSDVRELFFKTESGKGNFLLSLTDLANRGVKIPIEVVMSNEKKEAVALLTSVCESFEELDNGEAYECLDDLNVKGLIQWWAKHKPKSEREQKLEKIACVLCNNHQATADFLEIAERILNAIES